MYDAVLLQSLPFDKVRERWLIFRKPLVKKRTHYENKLCTERLNVFFGEMKLTDIHIGHINAYQGFRQNNDGGDWFPKRHPDQTPWPQKAGASIINHEISALQQILKLANLWDKIQPFYHPLPIPEAESPKILTEEQEMMVFIIAQQSEDTELAYLVASLTNNTGAAGTELRTLRLCDIGLNLRTPGFVVRSEIAKNKYRQRFVPLNDSGVEIMKLCIARAHKNGAVKPEHYLFPWRKGRSKTWDVTRPATSSWLRRPWKKLQDRTGLDWLTPHCLRHQHISIRLLRGEPPASVAKSVGHRDIQMTAYYMHIPPDHASQAVQAIDSGRRFELYKQKYPQFRQIA